MITAKMLMITVLEASKTTRFPIRKWIQWILRGLIPSEPELNAEHIKGIPYASIAPSVFIPITALPKYYQDTCVDDKEMVIIPSERSAISVFIISSLILNVRVGIRFEEDYCCRKM